MSLINKMLRDIDQRSSADQEQKPQLMNQVRPVKGTAAGSSQFLVLGLLGVTSLGLAAYYLSDQFLNPSPKADLQAVAVAPTPVTPSAPPTPSAAPSENAQAAPAPLNAVALASASETKPAAMSSANVVSTSASGPATSGASAEQQVTGLTRDWAAAWSAKNFLVYIGFYSDQFLPANNMARDQWAESRRVRIARPVSISVELSNVRAEKLSDQEIAVRFKQRYASDNFSETSEKTLVWQRVSGDWKIIREDANQPVVAAAPKEPGPQQRPPPRQPIKLAMQSAPLEVPLVIAAQGNDTQAARTRPASAPPAPLSAQKDTVRAEPTVAALPASPPAQAVAAPAPAAPPARSPEAGSFSITKSAPPPPAAPVTIIQNEVPGIAKILSPSQQSDNFFRQARALMQQGRIDEARVQLESALKAQPSNHQARQLLGQLLLDVRLIDDAEGLLAEGLKQAPKHAGMRIAMAHTLVQKDNFDGAINILLKEEPSARTNPDYQALLAALLQRRNRHEEAMEYYLNAVRLSPNNANWLVGLGISLQAQNIVVGAAEAFQRALDMGTLPPALAEVARQRLNHLKKNQPARQTQ